MRGRVYAALLHGLVRSGKGIAELTLNDLVWNCRIANAVGALTAAKYGAIPALPNAAMLKRFLKSNKSSNNENFLRIVLLSVFALYNSSAQERSPLVNFNHLEHLTEKMELNNDTVSIVHIYSNYPGYKWIDAKESGRKALHASTTPPRGSRHVALL